MSYKFTASSLAGLETGMNVVDFCFQKMKRRLSGRAGDADGQQHWYLEA
jgi:hypothetical protein